MPSDTNTTPPSAPTPNTTPNTPPAADTQPKSSVVAEVASRIGEAHNILVALSGDPSVDEMSAAIGLSLYLDKIGKRATAIYSGATPNALEFLKPEETFESSVDILQDFVIALNKEKADHLRYKLDGDYVKIFITPYRTRIGEEDLEFSYGDFNVDLVLALDVANGIDLDSALREHGRIMHDAVIINITTGNPGKFGEIEWSDKSASSVSEMIARLLYSINSKFKIEKAEATAFLTGIVAATNRFSNAKTTSDTMNLASRLMESGANQQLISKNITPDVDNELYSLGAQSSSKDPTKLNIKHGENEVEDTKEIDTSVTEKESTLLDDLKAAEASLAQAGAEAVQDERTGPIDINNLDAASTPAPAPVAEPTPEVAPAPAPEAIAESATEPTLSPDSSSDATPAPTAEPAVKAEKVIQPSADLAQGLMDDVGSSKYAQMLEDALNDAAEPSAAPEPAIPTPPAPEPVIPEPATSFNPATMQSPTVPTAPEINSVPEINYMPMPGEEVLPPPPTPPIDMSSDLPQAPAPEPSISSMPEPTAPLPEPTMPSAEPASQMPEPIMPAAPAPEPEPTPLGAQPAMQDQVYAPQASDPSAFKIPGM